MRLADVSHQDLANMASDYLVLLDTGQWPEVGDDHPIPKWVYDLTDFAPWMEMCTRENLATTLLLTEVARRYVACV